MEGEAAFWGDGARTESRSAVLRESLLKRDRGDVMGGEGASAVFVRSGMGMCAGGPKPLCGRVGEVLRDWASCRTGDVLEFDG
jgi:hypothetical protein